MRGEEGFVPLSLSKEERDGFVGDMTAIFEWAEVPVWTETKILEEFRGC